MSNRPKPPKGAAEFLPEANAGKVMSDDIEPFSDDMQEVYQRAEDALPTCSQMDQAEMQHQRDLAVTQFDSRVTLSRQNEPTPEIAREEAADIATNRYARYKEWYKHEKLIRAVLRDELEEFKHLRGIDEDATAGLFRLFYMQMGPDLIDAIIDGNLSRRVRGDDKLLAQASPRMRQTYGGSCFPGIYGQYIVDGAGFDLTGNRLIELLEFLRRYIRNELNLVNRDKAFESLRVRTHVTGTDGIVVEKRINKLKEFVESGQKIVDSLPEDSKSKHLSPFREFGYSKQCHIRLQQHFKGHGSNWLMHCILASMKWLFPKQYHLEQYMLLVITKRDRCVPAEKFITRLGQGYIDSFFGLSYHPAEINNGTGDKLDEETLDLAPSFQLDHTPFKENAERLQECNRQLPILREKLERALQDWFERQTEEDIKKLREEHNREVSELQQRYLLASINLLFAEEQAAAAGISLDGIPEIQSDLSEEMANPPDDPSGKDVSSEENQEQDDVGVRYVTSTRKEPINTSDPMEAEEEISQ